MTVFVLDDMYAIDRERRGGEGGNTEENCHVRYREKNDEKLAMIMTHQNIWPAFVLHEKDVCLGK